MEHEITRSTGLYLLWIDGAYDGITPNYDQVVCLTDVNVDDTVEVSDTSSACGVSSAPGTPKTSISANAYHLQDPVTGKISGSNLRPLIRAITTIAFKIAPVNPVVGDEIQEGVGFLSALSSTYSADTSATFSLTISPTSAVSTQIAGS